MNRFFIIASVFAGMMMFSCSSDEPQSEPKPEAPQEPGNSSNSEDLELKYKEYKPIDLTGAEKAVIGKYDQFGWRFFNKLNEEGENSLVSPLSASFALSMLLNGANGATYDEIATMLDLGVNDINAINSLYSKTVKQLVDVDNTTTVNIANSFWSTCGVKPLPTYVATLSESFDAEFYDVAPFDMVELFNKWCSDKTNGLIDKMINAPSDFILANALYFNGHWTHAFDKEKTIRGKFTCADGSQTDAMFMNTKVAGLGYADNEIYEAVSIPYGNGAYSLVAYLPAEGKTIGDCIEKIMGEGACHNFDYSYDVDLSLPRFEAETDMNIIDALKSLGMKTAFSDKSDFSKMCYDGVSIEQAKQKCVIKVEETGTVAAATTIFGIVTSIGPGSAVAVEFNRPFLYALTEKSTGSTLFIGTVNKL